MNREEREPLIIDDEPEGSFYEESAGNAVAAPNTAALFVPDGYRYHTKSEIEAFLNEELTKLGEEHSFLKIYTRAKELELFIKGILAGCKSRAIDGALALSGGAMGKSEYDGAEVQIKNIANTYEYTKAVTDMQEQLENIQTEINIRTAELQQQATELQESIAARKKYEQATQVVADKAKISKLGGTTLAITFKK